MSIHDPRRDASDAPVGLARVRPWLYALVGLLLFGVAGQIAGSMLQRARGRAQRRACHDKIKSLGGYNESYGGFLSALLDPRNRVAPLGPEEVALLRKVAPDFDPDDLGSGPGSWSHYLVT